MQTNFITESSVQTQKLGEDFIKKTDSRVIALYGELGSGKTTFAQGVARGLGIKRRITSPTFVIMRSYKINNKKVKAKYLYHVDLYRVERVDALIMELEELIKNPDNLLLIEWPEKIEKILSKNRTSIKFKYINENKRKVVIYG